MRRNFGYGWVVAVLMVLPGCGLDTLGSAATAGAAGAADAKQGQAMKQQAQQQVQQAVEAMQQRLPPASDESSH